VINLVEPVVYPDLIRFVSVPVRLELGFSLHLSSIYICTFGDYLYLYYCFGVGEATLPLHLLISEITLNNNYTV
jgi:hypothetical protein